MAEVTEPARTRIDLLTPADEAELRTFELDNRAFFAGAVGDRGDDFFATFSDRLRSLVDENEDGTSMLYAVRDQHGRVVGRVNIGPIEDGSGELGYRVAESAGGLGHARNAVRLALEAATEGGLSRVTALTTADNVASQRVLERNGFTRLGGGEPAEVEIGGRTHPTVHFERRLSRP